MPRYDSHHLSLKEQADMNEMLLVGLALVFVLSKNSVKEIHQMYKNLRSLEGCYKMETPP